MANRLGASVQVVRQRRIEGPPERIVAEILVRKVPEDQQAIGHFGWKFNACRIAGGPGYFVPCFHVPGTTCKCFWTT